MNTRIMAKFILFGRQKDDFEIELHQESEPTIEEAKELIYKKLHEAKDAEGNILKYDQDYDDGTPKAKERFDIFNTIQFLEIIVEYRKKMIKYSWRQAMLKNCRTRMVECTNYGCFVMTKTIM